MDQLPFLLLMVVVFVFFIILPQQRRQKKEKTFINSLKRGDRVITKSGIHGKVMELNNNDDSCVIETLAGKIKMEKSSLLIQIQVEQCQEEDYPMGYIKLWN